MLTIVFVWRSWLCYNPECSHNASQSSAVVLSSAPIGPSRARQVKQTAISTVVVQMHCDTPSLPLLPVAAVQLQRSSVSQANHSWQGLLAGRLGRRLWWVSGVWHALLTCTCFGVSRNCKLISGAVAPGGVTIGDGCTIGAGSVVTKSIPEYCVAVGNPARVVRELKKPH